MSKDFFTNFAKKFSSALCAQTDPEIFFPERGGSVVAAKEICMRCPERLDCLEDALVTREQFGIRGGLTERERLVLLKIRDRKEMK